MKKGNTRLHALDGLRGIAILFVFFSHANLFFIPTNFFTKFITSSGFVGVALLFILSGFLMAFLYPNPKNKQAFLQKRYTRIFPLFLSVILARIITWILLIKSWYGELIILLLVAVIVNIFWTRIAKNLFSDGFKRLIFISFFILQIVVGIFYIWVSLQPASFFYNEISNTVRLIITFFVNATLTFPVSTYAFVMDAVLWSLAAEVLFYVLYPVIFVPLVEFIDSKNNYLKILFALSIFPIFGGMFLISLHIGHLSFLSIYFYAYFITGISLGYLYRKNSKVFIKVMNKVKPLNFLSPLIFFLLIVLFLNFTSNPAYSNLIPWLWIIFSIPLTFLVALILNPNSHLAKIFSSKVMVYIGIISYSFYLTHTLVIRIVGEIFHPKTIIDFYIQFFLNLIFSILLASILYLLLEKPYFIKQKIKSTSKKLTYPYKKVSYPKLMGASLLFIYLVSIFIAYSSSFSFFSIEKRDDIPKSSLLKNSLELNITAKENNLGTVIIDLALPKSTQMSKERKVTFKIKEQGKKDWLSSSNYHINNLGDPFPSNFGFPLIQDSLGKKYTVQITVLGLKENLALSKNIIKSIYLIDKKSLITNPKLLGHVMITKIETVIANNEALIALLAIIPIAAVSLIIIRTQNKY